MTKKQETYAIVGVVLALIIGYLVYNEAQKKKLAALKDAFSRLSGYLFREMKKARKLMGEGKTNAEISAAGCAWGLNLVTKADESGNTDEAQSKLDARYHLWNSTTYGEFSESFVKKHLY